MSQKKNSGGGLVRLMRNDRPTAQVVVDELSDITGLPISALVVPTAERVQKELIARSAAWGELFPSILVVQRQAGLFAEYPDSGLRFFAENAVRLRAAFDYLSLRLYRSRSGRSDLFIRTMREHWAWRNLELFSLLAILTSSTRVDGPSDRWLSTLSRDGFRTWLFPSRSNDLLLRVGPVWRGDSGDAHHEQGLRETAIRAIRSFEANTPPLYDQDRILELSARDVREPVLDVESLRKELGATLDILASFPVSEVDELSANDIRSAVLASFATSRLGLEFDPEVRIPLRDAHATIPYSFLYPSETQPKRAIGLRGKSNNSRRRNIIYANVLSIPQDSEEGLSLTIGTSDTHRLSRAFRSRLGALRSNAALNQSHQRAEELRYLRRKLSGDLRPRLTVDDTRSDETALEEQELARRISRDIGQMTAASACIVYHYDRLRGCLEMLGAHGETKDGRPLVPSDYRWMEEAGGQYDTRSKSVAYQVVDRGKPMVFSVELKDPAQVEVADRQLTAPLRSNVLQARSVLAVPIRAFGRVWGVLELLSTRDRWFERSALLSCLQVSDEIGLALQQRRIAAALQRLEIAGAGDKAEPSLDVLAANIAALTLSDATAIWVSDLLAEDEFRLAGSVARPDFKELLAGGAPPKIGAETGPSAARDLVKRKGSWLSRRIGEPPLVGTWLGKPHARWLVDNGFNHLALIPVIQQSALHAPLFPCKERHRVDYLKVPSARRLGGVCTPIFTSGLTDGVDIVEQFDVSWDLAAQVASRLMGAAFQNQD